MRAGKLRNYVQIQVRQSVVVGPGDESLEWVTLTYWWCSLHPVESRERLAAGAIHPDTTHFVEGRYVPGVTSAMRLAHGSPARHFYLTSAPRNTDERGRRMEFEAKEDLPRAG